MVSAQDVFQKDSAADLIAVTGLDPAAMSMEEYSRRLEEWKRRNTKVIHMYCII